MRKFLSFIICLFILSCAITNNSENIRGESITIFYPQTEEGTNLSVRRVDSPGILAFVTISNALDKKINDTLHLSLYNPTFYDEEVRFDFYRKIKTSQC